MNAYQITLGPRGRSSLGATDLKLIASGIGAQAVRLEKNWHPTGYYTPADIAGVIKQLGDVYVRVRAPLVSFAATTIFRSLATRAREAITKIDSAQGQAISKYLTVATTSAAHGMKYIDAPGFRSFVIGYLRAMSIGTSAYQTLEAEYNQAIRDAIHAAGTSAVGKPMLNWFLNKTDLWSVVEGAGAAILKVVGVAYEVVKAAAGFVVSIPDTVGTLIKMAKWGIVLFGGVWIYDRYAGHRSS